MRPQSLVLLLGELEHQVLRETAGIATHLLVETLGRHPIESGEVHIENGSMTAKHQDRASDILDGNGQLRLPYETASSMAVLRSRLQAGAALVWEASRGAREFARSDSGRWRDARRPDGGARWR